MSKEYPKLAVMYNMSLVKNSWITDAGGNKKDAW